MRCVCQLSQHLRIHWQELIHFFPIQCHMACSISLAFPYAGLEIKSAQNTPKGTEPPHILPSPVTMAVYTASWTVRRDSNSCPWSVRKWLHQLGLTVTNVKKMHKLPSAFHSQNGQPNNNNKKDFGAGQEDCILAWLCLVTTVFLVTRYRRIWDNVPMP